MGKLFSTLMMFRKRVWFRPARIGILLPSCLLLLCINTGCTHITLWSTRTPVNEGQKPEIKKPQIIIADNKIYLNNQSGLRVRGNTPVLIKKCDIYQNGSAGVMLENAADATIEDSNFFQNDMAGLASNNPTRILLKNSQVHQNGEGGIRIRRDDSSNTDPAYVTIEHNKIFLNQQGGIYAIATTPDPIQLMVSENNLYRNGETGIRIEDNIRMTAVGNRLYKNGTAGIASYITGEIPPLLDIYQNTIFSNSGAGIFIHSGMSGQVGISNNLLYGNHRAGIACGLWGETGSDRIDLQIFHNTIVSNGSEEEGAGIRNDSQGNVIIKNNILAYNFTTGIMTYACGDNTYNLLFANGETSAVKDTSNDLFFLTEKLQYSGCSGIQWGDVLGEPRFVNPDQYNFSLQENSPAKDAADPIDSLYFQNTENRDIGATPLLLPVDPLQEGS